MATLTKTIRKHIFLHPSDRHDMQKAIKSVIMKDKKKHNDRLGGALLDVSSLKVVGDRHLLVDGNVSMEVVAKVDVFAPSTGMRLEGVINKRSKGHVGCLVLDTFNAMLTVPRGSSLDPHLGDTCQFQVTELVVDDSMLFLRGKLLEILHTSDEIGSSQIETHALSTADQSFFERELQNEESIREDMSGDKQHSTVDEMDSSVFSTPSKKSKKRKSKDAKEKSSQKSPKPQEDANNDSKDVTSDEKNLTLDEMDSAMLNTPSKKSKKRKSKDISSDEKNSAGMDSSVSITPSKSRKRKARDSPESSSKKGSEKKKKRKLSSE